MTTVGMGIDIGRVRDNTVLVIASRRTPKKPIHIRGVRILANTPFSEEPGGQYYIERANIVKFEPDLVVVDQTDTGGMATVDWLRENVDSTVWGYTFTAASKSELLGIAKQYYTARLVRMNPKFRQVRVELGRIRREVGPGGGVRFVDDPHGDVGWAATLAIWAVNAVDGAVGMADFSRIFDRTQVRPTSPFPERQLPATPPPAPKGMKWGMMGDGSPYLFRVPEMECGEPLPDGSPCKRLFTQESHLNHHKGIDHPE